jgi:hypothetical protein
MREFKHGWLAGYLDYTRPQQSPIIFHTWVGVSCIASALRRRVWIDRGYYTLYPNLFTILVSGSGVGMKTTAMKIGVENILAKAVPDLTIMRGALTTRFLVDFLSQAGAKSTTGNAEATVFCEEFKVFAKGLYADSGLIENLTKIFDNGIWEYSTGGQGVFRVEKPCVNMIAGSTPEWLTTGSAADFIGGGFSSRIIPVALLKDEKCIAWPEKSQVEKDLEDKLIKDLTQISTVTGQFFITQEAKDYFEKWYKIRNDKRISDHRLDGWYSKKHDMVLKVAMTAAMSLGDDLVILPEHVETSIKLLSKLEENIPFAFQGVAWGEEAKFQDKVLSKIKEGTIPHSVLLQSFHYCMSGDDLSKIIKTLCDEDVIEFEPVTFKGKRQVQYKFKGEKGEKK